MAVPEVERVVQELLIVCSEVKANGNGRLWANAIGNKSKQKRRYMAAYPAPAMYKESFPIEIPIPLTQDRPSRGFVNLSRNEGKVTMLQARHTISDDTDTSLV